MVLNVFETKRFQTMSLVLDLNVLISIFSQYTVKRDLILPPKAFLDTDTLMLKQVFRLRKKLSSAAYFYICFKMSLYPLKYGKYGSMGCIPKTEYFLSLF